MRCLAFRSFPFLSLRAHFHETRDVASGHRDQPFESTAVAPEPDDPEGQTFGVFRIQVACLGGRRTR